MSRRDPSRKGLFTTIKNKITDEVYNAYTKKQINIINSWNEYALSNYSYDNLLDRETKRRLKIIGTNYLSTLFTFRLEHVGWGKFLKDNFEEISKCKKLLGDPDIHTAKLGDIDFVLKFRQKVINKFGNEYGDKYKLLMEKSLSLGFGEMYPPEELEGLNDKDIEDLKEYII